MPRWPLALVLSIAFSGCAGAVRPLTRPPNPRRDAVLVIPGFAYGRSAERTFEAVRTPMQAQGYDLYVASYLSRHGLAASRRSLLDFVRVNHLDRYRSVHVVAFIAGAWTVNPLIDRNTLPNLRTVVYDRSPFQERAPRLAAEDLPLLAWLRYGATIFEIARTPYRPIDRTDIAVGLLIETKPTNFLRRHARAADRLGPYDFTCPGLGQRYTDCAFVPLAHNELYSRFPEVWPELQTFMETRHFSAAANRTAPQIAGVREGQR